MKPKIRDSEILVSSILHDTLEDTDASIAELQEKFGSNLANIVQELTNDPNLTSDEKKQRQIDKVPLM